MFFDFLPIILYSIYIYDNYIIKERRNIDIYRELSDCGVSAI